VENIFNPFFRTKDTRLVKAEGTGLGLAIVKHIMDAHQGEVIVKTSPCKGSKFTLLFPMEK
jgi:two-component system phosphate regulon sensor histidine kinase PhoR